MKTKHTKGEWELADNEIHKEHQFTVIAFPKTGCRAIADTYLNRMNPKESEANAKLIAAAPGMLEMLIKISNVSNVAFTLKGFDVKRLKAEINNEIKKATK